MSEQAKPTRDSVRAEIEAAQREFHELVDSLSDEDWTKRTPNESWRVHELLWHTAWGNQFIPGAVAECRKGRGIYPPAWLFAWVNRWITRIGARKATKASVKEKYDAGIARVLECLETVQDDEWDKALEIAGRRETMLSILQTPSRHLAEHKADVLKGIGRA